MDTLNIIASVVSIIAAIVSIIAARKTGSLKNETINKIKEIRGGINIIDSTISGNKKGGIHIER